MKIRSILLAAGLAMISSFAADAQTYPSKPVRLVMPVAPGGVADLTVRTASQDLTTRMGQALIVENRAGAAMIPGVEACTRGVPDGYTICAVSPDAMSFNPHIFERLSYDPDRDLKPVGNMFFVIEGFIAAPTFAPNTVAEARALAVSKPGFLNFATMGPGTSPDVFRQWLNQQWKTDIVGIHYKGGSLVVNAVMASEVHVAKIGMGNFAGQIGGGKLKILAVSASKRLRLLPDVQTTGEAGLDGFGFRVWWGLVAPAATPDAIVYRINSEFNRLYQEPKYVDLLERSFLDPDPGTPQAFAAFLKKDREIVGRMVKTYNIPKQ